MVARARLAEDTLVHGVETLGTQQYLILGAGLDTFAYRNPFPNVRVFEVDHPATQAWKHTCLTAASIAIPPSAHLVPVDFEQQSLAAQLAAAGFDPTLPTVTAWLGVVPTLPSKPSAAPPASWAASRPAVPPYSTTPNPAKFSHPPSSSCLIPSPPASLKPANPSASSSRRSLSKPS